MIKYFDLIAVYYQIVNNAYFIGIFSGILSGIIAGYLAAYIYEKIRFVNFDKQFDSYLGTYEAYKKTDIKKSDLKGYIEIKSRTDNKLLVISYNLKPALKSSGFVYMDREKMGIGNGEYSHLEYGGKGYGRRSIQKIAEDVIACDVTYIGLDSGEPKTIAYVWHKTRSDNQINRWKKLLQLAMSLFKSNQD